MADPQVDIASGPAAQRASGDGKTSKSARAEPASFRPGEGWPSQAAHDLISARRDAGLAGADLWVRSFEPFYAFHNSMLGWFDELWREAINGLYPAEPSRAMSAAPLMGLPPVDVLDTADAYVLTMEAPGLTESEVDAIIEGECLVLRGHKRQNNEDAASTYRLSERRFGRFERRFRLPSNVTRDKLDVALRDGVLRVALSKRRAAEASPPGVVRH